jgi:hypothetical protein
MEYYVGSVGKFAARTNLNIASFLRCLRRSSLG